MHIKVPTLNLLIKLAPSPFPQQGSTLISSKHLGNLSGIMVSYNLRVEQALRSHLTHLPLKRKKKSLLPPLGQLFKNPREGETTCVWQEVNSCIKRKWPLLPFFVKLIIGCTKHLLCPRYQYTASQSSPLFHEAGTSTSGYLCWLAPKPGSRPLCNNAASTH